MNGFGLIVPAVLGVLSVSALGAPVEFAITVPASSSTGDHIFLVGNVAGLGDWRADGLRVPRGKDGRFRVKIDLLVGTDLEFKVTRGTWDTVERTTDGADIDNRRHRVSGPEIIEIVVASFGTDSAQRSVEHTLTGNVRFHYAFWSGHLRNQRTIAVYLPPDYETGDGRYAVIYMHDGQNVFDAATSSFGVEWRADEHAENLIADGQIEPVIIVGIYSNDDRMAEMTPDADSTSGRGGKGPRYAKFIVEELVPFINAEYRTNSSRNGTAICGSSAGGLISLYVCAEYPQVFGKCAAVSPALMWNGHSLLNRYGKSDGLWMRNVRFWIDMGTDEQQDIDQYRNATEDARKLSGIFDRAGLRRNAGYRYDEITGGRHNEEHWSRRFGDILIFLFGPE